MKSQNQNSIRGIQKKSVNRSKSANVLRISLLLLTITLIIFACGKQGTVEEPIKVSGTKSDGETVSAQPLPGGDKTNFTVVTGRFQTSTGQAAWARITNWTLVASTGRINSTYSQWSSVNEFGKTYLSNHTCSIDPAKPHGTCGQYAPTGWIVGTSTNPSVNISGNYTLIGTALKITWDNGKIENWTVSVPETGLAKVEFVSSPTSLYVTHGRGYGSKAAWTIYKKVASMPRARMTGSRASCSYGGPASGVYSVTNWTDEAVDFSSMTSSANGLALHMKVPSSENVCKPESGCYVPSTGNTGIIYHFAASTADNSRNFVYNHHCACIPAPQGQGDAGSSILYPCYTGNIHPYAMRQIINDAGVIRGMVGIEQQDQPGSAGFAYQLKEWIYN